jgi:hypothetical protein
MLALDTRAINGASRWSNLGQKIEYLIVGGYAVMKYTDPHFTKDLDLWVNNSQDNSNRVYCGLAQFGAPLIQDG